VTGLLVEIVAWTGVGTLLGAYALLAWSHLSRDSWPYHLANLIGASLLAWNSAMVGHTPFLAFNLVWASVGIAGVVRAVRRRNAAGR